MDAVVRQLSSAVNITANKQSAMCLELAIGMTMQSALSAMWLVGHLDQEKYVPWMLLH